MLPSRYVFRTCKLQKKFPDKCSKDQGQNEKGKPANWVEKNQYGNLGTNFSCLWAPCVQCLSILSHEFTSASCFATAVSLMPFTTLRIYFYVHVCDSTLLRYRLVSISPGIVMASLRFFLHGYYSLRLLLTCDVRSICFSIGDD